MKLLCRTTAIAAILVGVSGARAADVAPKQIPARIELHQIRTLTLSDQQFLTGDAAGKPVTVSGELRIAQGVGRLPVVILQHGSGGMAGNIDVWSRDLNELGISTFALDGFTGRGITETNSNQALLGRLNLILDIYGALDVLTTHPRVDPKRVALMGFSRGGQATLYASLKRFQTMWNKSGIEFAAYIPFYPDCKTAYISDTEVADRPIRIFGGGADDYNPIAACKAFVERLRAAGHDVELSEYPDVSHAFDNPLGAQPAAVAPTFESVRNCDIREEPNGMLVDVATGQPFTYKDACVAHGPHLGYDPSAAQAAKTSVNTFLKALFLLECLPPVTAACLG